MLDDHRATAAATDDDATEVREIHALTEVREHPPSSFSSSGPAGRRDQSWELTSYRSPNLSLGGSDVENFTTMSREFNAMVVAGATMQTPTDHHSSSTASGETAENLRRIGEDEQLEETNPLAIVPDSNPIPSPRRAGGGSIGRPAASTSSADNSTTSNSTTDVSVHQVKKEEVESKIAAWQTAEIAKINNRFKREDVVINGWESEQVEKAPARLKKVERKLNEQRARAMEKTQNEVAKARRKAEEKRASAEAKRGTKVAKVLELSNLLRAVGRAPSKRPFF